MESIIKSDRYMGVRITGMTVDLQTQVCRVQVCNGGGPDVCKIHLLNILCTGKGVLSLLWSEDFPRIIFLNHFFFILAALLVLPESVEADECPEFPKQHSVQCPPHSAADQCKYDADCPESGNQCCLIGCQKMCLNPKAIREAISGKRAYQDWKTSSSSFQGFPTLY